MFSRTCSEYSTDWGEMQVPVFSVSLLTYSVRLGTIRISTEKENDNSRRRKTGDD